MNFAKPKFRALDLVVGLVCTGALLGLLELSRHADVTNLNVYAALAFAILHFTAMAYGRHRTKRARARHDALVTRQRDELRATNEDLETTVTLIRETLASVDEHFLLFGPDGTCFVTPSARTAGVLGFQPEGRELVDIVQIPAAARADVRAWFTMLFDGPVPFETLTDLGPASFRDHASGRTFRIKYFPLRNDARVENVIVTLLDVTASVEARAARAVAEGRTKFILAVAQHGPDFAAFVKDLRRTCARATDLDPDVLRHELHTHKGTASIFFIEPVVAAIHAVELALGTGDEHARAAILNDLAVAVPRALGEFLKDERAILAQLRVFDAHDLVVTKSVLTAARLQVGHDPRALSLFDDVVTRFRGREVSQVLMAFDGHVTALAARLGKAVRLELAPDSEFCALLTERYRPVTQALIHLLNNAVDHGFESPAERTRANKAPVGRLRVGVNRVVINELPFVQIKIADDGRGIDAIALRRTLSERGVDVGATDDAEVLNHVFDLGVTTKAVATDVSGLGVGLNGLRALCLSLGGHLTVGSEVGRGTTFTLSLPAPATEVWFLALDVAWSVAAA